MKTEVQFPHAKVHSSLHPANIFRPLQRDRKRGLEYKSETANCLLEVRVWEELNVWDQSLLLLICAIATSDQMRETIHIEDENFDILEPLNINLKGETNEFRYSDLPAYRVRATGYLLLKELGKGKGLQDTKWLTQSLRRLSHVSFYYQGKDWEGSFSLLSWQRDVATNEFLITINPISTYAIGFEPFVYTCLKERQMLSQTESKLLHYRLTGLIRRGGSRSIKVMTLINYIWGEDKCGDEALRQRRGKVKKALKEIDSLVRWSTSVVGRGPKALAKVARLKNGNKGQGRYRK